MLRASSGRPHSLLGPVYACVAQVHRRKLEEVLRNKTLLVPRVVRYAIPVAMLRKWTDHALDSLAN